MSKRFFPKLNFTFQGSLHLPVFISHCQPWWISRSLCWLLLLFRVGLFPRSSPFWFQHCEQGKGSPSQEDKTRQKRIFDCTAMRWLSFAHLAHILWTVSHGHDVHTDCEFVPVQHPRKCRSFMRLNSVFFFPFEFCISSLPLISPVYLLLRPSSHSTLRKIWLLWDKLWCHWHHLVFHSKSSSLFSLFSIGEWRNGF